MTSLAAFLAWLIQAPRWFRVAETVRLLLGEAVRVLVAPETGRLHDLDEAAIRAVERAVQTAEAGLSLAVWLLAHRFAGIPAPRTWRAPLLIPSRRPPTPLELAQRTFALCQRLRSIHESAQALAPRLGLGGPQCMASRTYPREPDSRRRGIPSRRARKLTPAHSSRTNLSTRGRIQNTHGVTLSSIGARAACGQTGPPAGRSLPA